MFGGLGSSNASDDVPVEHLDYAYVRACTDENELAKILGVLRSGKEGLFPDLERCTVDCLRTLNPAHRALRVSEPAQKMAHLGGEGAALQADLAAWEQQAYSDDTALKGSKRPAAGHDLPPPRSAARVPVSVSVSAPAATVPAATAPPTEPPKPAQQSTAPSARPAAYDYRAWDKWSAGVKDGDDDDDTEPAAPPPTAPKGPKPTPSHGDTAASVVPAPPARLPEVLPGSLGAGARARAAAMDKDKGNECMRSHDYEEALQYYSRSIGALANLKLKRWADALSDCDAALALDGDNVKAMFRRATALKELGRRDAALQEADRLADRMAPNSQELRQLQADIAKLPVPPVPAPAPTPSPAVPTANARSTSDTAPPTRKKITITEVDSAPSPSSTTNVPPPTAVGGPTVAPAPPTTAGSTPTPAAVQSSATANSPAPPSLGTTPSTAPAPRKKVLIAEVDAEPTVSTASQAPNTNQPSANITSASPATSLPTGPVAGSNPSPAAAATAAAQASAPIPIPIPTATPAPNTTANEEFDPLLPPAVSTARAKAEQAHATGQYAEAVQLYSTALAPLDSSVLHAKTRAALLAGRAASAHKSGDSKACVRDCSEALATALQVPTLLQRAAALETLEQYARAAEDYAAVLRVAPGSAPARGGAERCRKMQQMDGAPSRSLQGADREYEAFKSLGNELFKQDLFARAVPCYTRCAELLPTDAVALSNRAQCYLKLGLPVLAAADADEVLRRDPTFAKGYFRRATARTALGHLDAALQDWEALLRLDPGNDAAPASIKDLRSRLGLSGGAATSGTKANGTSSSTSTAVRRRVPIQEVGGSATVEDPDLAALARQAASLRAEHSALEDRLKSQQAAAAGAHQSVQQATATLTQQQELARASKRAADSAAAALIGQPYVSDSDESASDSSDSSLSPLTPPPPPPRSRGTNTGYTAPDPASQEPAPSPAELLAAIQQFQSDPTGLAAVLRRVPPGQLARLVGTQLEAPHVHALGMAMLQGFSGPELVARLEGLMAVQRYGMLALCLEDAQLLQLRTATGQVQLDCRDRWVHSALDKFLASLQM